jgi:hypothetical protein
VPGTTKLPNEVATTSGEGDVRQEDFELRRFGQVYFGTCELLKDSGTTMQQGLTNLSTMFSANGPIFQPLIGDWGLPGDLLDLFATG